MELLCVNAKIISLLEKTTKSMSKTNRRRNKESARSTERRISKTERKKVKELIKDGNHEDLPDYQKERRVVREELK